jgi:hypothetical protein
MQKITVTVATLLTLVAAADIYQRSTGAEVAIAPDLGGDAVLLAAAPDVLTKVLDVGSSPACAECTGWIWDGAKRTPEPRWCCNGAVMNRSISAGLDEAKARAAELKEAEAIPE